MSDKTQLIRHQANIYKVRINYATSSQELREAVSFEAIKPAIRAVLYAEERGRSLSKIDLGDFIVSCSKKYWKTSEKLGFKQHDKILEAYPYLLILTVDFKVSHTHRTDTESTITSRKSLLGSSNSHSSKRQPVVVLSRIHIPSNQSRSSKPQPVVVLDKLNLPVSKKPDKGCHETQRRISPRRKKTDLDDFDSSPAKKKRYRDAISDENLPFCREAKVSKIGSEKSKSLHDSPRKAFKENGTNLNSNSMEIEKGRKPMFNGDSLNPTGIDRLRSPRRQPPSVTTGLTAGLSPNKLKSPRRGSFAEAEGSIKDRRLDILRSPRNRHQGLPSFKEGSGDIDPAQDTKGQRPLRSNSPREKHKRSSSGFWSLLETLMTPVKLFTRRRTK